MEYVTVISTQGEKTKGFHQATLIETLKNIILSNEINLKNVDKTGKIIWKIIISLFN